MAKIKQATKKTGRPVKEEIVAELVQKLDNSNGLVFANYQGLTHKQLEGLKKELKKLDSTIVIAKNSLLKISLGKSKKFADFKDNEGLNLPTATLFIQGDMVEPLKKIQKSIKDSGLPKIKFGILEGQLLDEAGVIKIASLPNRETLIAQFIGVLNSPIQGLVVTLNGTIQKFVMTLDAIAQSKPTQSETTQAEPASPTVAPVSSEASTQEPVTEAKEDQSTPNETPSEPVAEVSNEAQETTETENQTEDSSAEEVDNKGGEN